ncbi:MAG: hypothetical protein JWP91_2538 [Fibrobacteres bacterium]|nr:hypothetical protein [Fibrobacterota bacterium]
MSLDFRSLCLMAGVASFTLAHSESLREAISLRQWSVGPLLGMDFSRPDTKPNPENGGPGAMGGFRFQWDAMPKGLQPYPKHLASTLDPRVFALVPTLDFMIEMKGIRKAVGLESGGHSSRVEMVSVETPLLLKIGFVRNQIGIHLLAGPALAYNSYEIEQAPGERLSEKDFEAWDFLGQAGVGLTFLLSPTLDVVLDTRYSHGFRNLLADDIKEISPWHARDVQVQLAVLFYPNVSVPNSSGSGTRQGLP